MKIFFILPFAICFGLSLLRIDTSVMPDRNNEENSVLFTNFQSTDPKAKEIWDIYLSYKQELKKQLSRMETAYTNAGDPSLSLEEMHLQFRTVKAAASTLWTKGMTTRAAVRKHVDFRENWFADFLTSDCDNLQEYMTAHKNLADAFLTDKPQDAIQVAQRSVTRTEAKYKRTAKELEDAAATYKTRNAL